MTHTAPLHNSADQILLRLKSQGELSAGDIAEALSISRMGAHKALNNLLAEGLVRARDRVHGRGRPQRLFSLTAAGHARFPDRHADLNAELIGHIRTVFGEEGLDRLIAERENRQKQRYADVSADDAPMAERVSRLASIRAEEGYMAHVADQEDGSMLLVEDHCPICAAAEACQGFCRSELTMFRLALGPDAEVERVEHLLSGARRCAYRVRQSS